MIPRQIFKRDYLLKENMALACRATQEYDCCSQKGKEGTAAVRTFLHTADQSVSCELEERQQFRIKH